MSHVLRNVVRALLAALFLLSVYRAATQSIVHDEAYTWELYLAGPASAIFHHFDANHHFLNTILMKISSTIFGTSEFSLRLPALIGAALYFAAIDRLASFFKNPWVHLVAAALMSMNPFVLDFMAAARGYGLALALWTWALVLIAEQNPKRALLAGVALGLSVTANLVFLPPGAVLAVAGIYFLKPRTPETPKKKRAAEPKQMAPWIHFVAPMAAIALAYVLLAPIENANLGDFYVGVDTIGGSMRSLAQVSLQHSGPLRSMPWNRTWSDIVAFGLAPIVTIAGLFIAYRKRDTLMLLVGGSIAISAFGLVALHVVLERPYPIDRTGIYFLPLVGLLLALIADREPGASIPALTIGVVVVAQFATEFNTRKFFVWEYDADTRTIAQTIADRRDKTAATVHVGSSFVLSHALYFYASKNGWTWFELTNRPTAGADFNALSPQERDQLGSLGAVEVYEGPVSHSILAVKR